MISNPKGGMDYELGGGVYAAPSGWRVAPPLPPAGSGTYIWLKEKLTLQYPVNIGVAILQAKLACSSFLAIPSPQVVGIGELIYL